MTKTLGIIGGMGPLATTKLFRDIVLNTKANKDQDHIPILIDNNVKVPDRTSFILGRSNEDPRDELIKSAKKLEKIGADFLVMSCNTAHFFYEDIVKEINIPFLHMIDEVAKEISKDNSIKKVGIFATEGTIRAGVYSNVFSKYDIEILSPSIENQKYITDIIYNIKEDIPQENLDGYNKAKKELVDRGADIFVAGCTEISVAKDLYELSDIVDPMNILVSRIIEFAGKEEK